MPKGSATGFISAFFAVFLGFGLIWHIWWLVILAIIACIGVLLRQAWDTDRDMYITRRGARGLRPAASEPGSAAMSGGANTAVLDAHGKPDSAVGARTGLDLVDDQLRLLAVPAQRHRDLRVAVRHLRGAVQSNRRRPLGPRHFRSEECLHRNLLPAGLELHLRPDADRGRTPPAARSSICGQS